MEETRDPSRAFEFSGTWRDYAPIAFTNLGLTIVTLGIYRFWAKARERRYLWSHTRFIDDQLEWTGTGMELFVGFILALLLFGVPLLFLRFGIQALVLRGHPGIASLTVVALYPLLLFLFGVARFRALRYRLSRSWWHGIRGGSDDQGFGYGLSSAWKTLAGAFVMALLIPWSMTELWNQRWNKMSFGPFAFGSGVTTSGLMRRWIAVLATPIIIGIAIGGVVYSARGNQTVAAASAGIGILAIYGGMALVGLGYWAAFLRHAIDALSLERLEFRFDARSREWLMLFLGNIALVVVTLGVGIAFIGYRNWRFFITHLDALGEIDLDQLVQSTTRAPGQGEGLIEAFDIGAF